MKQPVAAVTGASGGIAQSLLPALLERYTVKALFRGETDLCKAWANRGCQIVLGDLGSVTALKQLVSDSDVVFHCAAKITGFSPADFTDINVRGTERLVAAVADQGCRRFVHLSSIAVYLGAEPVDGGVSETMALDEKKVLDAYGRSKLLAENAVVKGFQGATTDYVILRPTFVYGPHIRSWTLLPLKLLLKKRGLFIGVDAGEGLLDAVYVEDVVQSMLAAAEVREAGRQVFNIGHERITFREFYGFLGEMAGCVPKLGSEKRLRQIARCAHSGRRISEKFFSGVENGIGTILEMSLNQSAYASKKAREILGYSPRFTLPLGMLRTELWLRESGMIPEKTRTIRNVDGHYVIQPTALARPSSEQEIIDVIREASRRKMRVRAIGSLHSFAPIPGTDGITLALNRYNKILAIGESTVTVQGGITLAALNRELAAQKKALPIHGSHCDQTVAGAISTATHGGSIHHGPLSDYVERIRLITSRGEPWDLAPSDPDFYAAVVSLGLLGVISTVTLKCIPQFFLQPEISVQPFATVLDQFESIQTGNDYVDLRYHPQLGQVEVYRINRIDPPTGPWAPPPAGRQPARLQQKLVSAVLRTLLRTLAATRSESMHRSIVTNSLGKTYPQRSGPSDYVLAFTDLSAGEPFPIDDLEFAVPYSAARPALQALAGYFERMRDFPRFFPVHIRCSKKGPHWLSPNYDQEVCWLEFWHFPPNPRLYAAIEQLLRPFAYRVHLGKLTPADPKYLRQQYPRWNDFLQVRQRLDPNGMFANKYLAGLELG